MDLVPLGPTTLLRAWSIAEEVFPGEGMLALQCYFTSLLPPVLWSQGFRLSLSRLEYFLAVVGREVVGITGLYVVRGMTEDAWLGWYGIRPPKRRRGLGAHLLQQTVNLARARHHTRLRLWTTIGDETEAARRLYSLYGFASSETSFVFDGHLPIVALTKELSANVGPPEAMPAAALVGVAGHVIEVPPPLSGDESPTAAHK